jgi:hypothetical protein
MQTTTLSSHGVMRQHTPTGEIAQGEQAHFQWAPSDLGVGCRPDRTPRLHSTDHPGIRRRAKEWHDHAADQG